VEVSGPPLGELYRPAQLERLLWGVLQRLRPKKSYKAAIFLVKGRSP